MLISPTRDANEDEECWRARLAEYRDLKNFENGAALKLKAWNVTRHCRMNLDASIEVARTP